MNPEPIQLHLDEAGSVASSGSGTFTIVLISALGALVILALLFFLQRRTELFSRNDQDAAFRLLARRLTLSSTQRALVRSLAQRTSTPPVALLICESAYTRAVDALAKLSNTDRARLVDIQRRIFSDD